MATTVSATGIFDLFTASARIAQLTTAVQNLQRENQRQDNEIKEALSRTEKLRDSVNSVLQQISARFDSQSGEINSLKVDVASIKEAIRNIQIPSVPQVELPDVNAIVSGAVGQLRVELQSYVDNARDQAIATSKQYTDQSLAPFEALRKENILTQQNIVPFAQQINQYVNQNFVKIADTPTLLRSYLTSNVGRGVLAEIAPTFTFGWLNQAGQSITAMLGNILNEIGKRLRDIEIAGGVLAADFKNLTATLPGIVEAKVKEFVGDVKQVANNAYGLAQKVSNDLAVKARDLGLKIDEQSQYFNQRITSIVETQIPSVASTAQQNLINALDLNSNYMQRLISYIRVNYINPLSDTLNAADVDIRNQIRSYTRQFNRFKAELSNAFANLSSVISQVQGELESAMAIVKNEIRALGNKVGMSLDGVYKAMKNVIFAAGAALAVASAIAVPFTGGGSAPGVVGGVAIMSGAIMM